MMTCFNICTATHFLPQNYCAHKVKKIRKINIIFYFCIKQNWCRVILKKEIC